MTAVVRQDDYFQLRVLWTKNTLADRGAVRRVLEGLQREAGDFAPTTLWKRHDRSEPLRTEAVERLLTRRKPPDRLSLGRDEVDLGVEWSGFPPESDPGASLSLTVPLSFVADPARAAARADQLIALSIALCRASPPAYGWGHSEQDVKLGKDPHVTNSWAPKKLYQVYWLTILGAPLVEKLGRDRVLTTPCHRLELFDSGAALLVTHPLPGEFATPAAREAQARALSHLCPDRSLDEILDALNERSALLAPVERAFHPDLGEAFEILLAAEPLATRAARERALSAYRPAEVTEWIPADRAPAPDVDDVAAAIDSYHRRGETFVVGFDEHVPGLVRAEPDTLPRIDAHFYLADYPGHNDPATVERLLLGTLGAHLGNLLERFLDGRWIPRKNPLEASVVVGDRAWLPFARVQRFLQSREAAVDASLTRFYREAERHAR